MPSGKLLCRDSGTNDCARGREVGELDEANQRAAANVSRAPLQDGGAIDAETYVFTANSRDPREQTP